MRRRLIPIAVLILLLAGFANANQASKVASEETVHATTTIGPEGGGLTVTFGDTDTTTVSGAKMSVSIEPEGTVVYNPTTIALEGKVDAYNKVVGDNSFYAWRARNMSVILKQPASWIAPAFENGTIRFEDAGLEPGGPTIAGDLEARARIRIRICNTWPNADVNLDLMRCVVGGYRCMSCITSEY